MTSNYRRSFANTRNRLYELARAISLKTALLALLISVGAYFLFIEIDTRTYVWQVTALASHMRTILRTQCPASTSRETQVNQASMNLLQSPPHSQSLKLAVLILYDSNSGDWSPQLLERLLDNKRRYCERHGYHFIVANDFLDRSRSLGLSAAWSKLLALDHYLPQYDILGYLDMDTVILNFDLPLHALLQRHNVPSDRHLIVTADWNGLNTGVFLLRNSTWSTSFLQAAWSQAGTLSGRRSADGRPLPFLYEQRAFHLLINSAVWQRRGLPQWRGNPSISDNRQHVWYLPQCAMNSYVLHPLDRRAESNVNGEGDGYEVTQYVPGDLLVHFAGKKGRKRVRLMEHFLDISEATSASSSATSGVKASGGNRLGTRSEAT